MKEEYTAPRLEVLGDLRGVTSGLSLGGESDLLGRYIFGEEEPGDGTS